MRDARKRLAAAEERLSGLMNGCDELHEENRRRCEELARRVESGEALEGELLGEQVAGESREGIQRTAAMDFEERVVRPLRLEVQELELAEGVKEAARLDAEAIAARGALEEFLKRAGEEERGLRRRVSELEETSARMQRWVRRVRMELGR